MRGCAAAAGPLCFSRSWVGVLPAPRMAGAGSPALRPGVRVVTGAWRGCAPARVMPLSAGGILKPGIPPGIPPIMAPGPRADARDAGAPPIPARGEPRPTGAP